MPVRAWCPRRQRRQQRQATRANGRIVKQGGPGICWPLGAKWVSCAIAKVASEQTVATAMRDAALNAFIFNLLTGPGYYDVALRDFGLMLGALTLTRLAWAYDRRS